MYMNLLETISVKLLYNRPAAIRIFCIHQCRLLYNRQTMSHIVHPSVCRFLCNKKNYSSYVLHPIRYRREEIGLE